MGIPSIDLAAIERLLSVGQIAGMLKRPHQSIHRKIAKLNLQPVLTLNPGGARYDPSVVEIIGASLRRPNHNRQITKA